jgi:hypothetical protein
MNDKRPNNKLEEKVVFAYDHASVSATTTIKLWKCPTGKSFVLDRASYISPTGLVGDATNAFAGTIQNGATVMATLFNTDTGDAGGATLPVDTFVEGTLSATAANTWLAAGDVMSLVLTEDAAAVLPAGRVVIEGRLL